jgi:hypothetical protein
VVYYRKDALRLDIHNVVTLWTDEEHLGHLRAATQLNLQTADEIHRYVHALKQSAHIAKDAAIAQEMKTNLDFTFKYLWAMCVEEGTTAADVEEAVELAQLLWAQLMGAHVNVNYTNVTGTAIRFLQWRDALRNLPADGNIDEKKVLAAVEMHEKVLFALANRDTAELEGGGEGTPAIWAQKILDVSSELQGRAMEMLSAPTRNFLNGMLQTLARATTAMEERAGGMTNGQHWAAAFVSAAASADAPKDILAIFGSTLDTTDKVAAAEFEKRLKELTGAYKNYTSAKTKYRAYAPFCESSNGSGAARRRDEETRLEKAQGAILLAQTTRLEVFLGRALLHGKAKSRMVLKAKGDFESKTGKNAARCAQAALWSLADGELTRT